MQISLSNSRHHIATMVALFFLTASVYMISYSGHLRYNDELQMFNGMSSLIEFGDTRYDIALWNVWDSVPDFSEFSGQVYPLPETLIEPGLAVAAAPLYLLGKIIPGIGLLHISWLLNILLGGAISALMYAQAIVMGYRRVVGLAAALLLVFTTILWPYSRLFMREPLLVFLVLLTLHLIEHARRRNWLAGVLITVTFLAACFTKVEIAALIPAFVIYGLLRGNYAKTRWFNNLSILAILLIAGGILALIYTDLIYTLFPRTAPIMTTSFRARPAFFQVALHSYLLSPNVSIWATSPVLLLVLPGVYTFIRRQKWHIIWAMVFALMTFAVGHALTTGPHWFAGATLPPRFLIPVIPFLLLCILPVLDYIIDRRVSRFIITGFVLLVLYSLWWQITGIALPWHEYVDALPAESGYVTSWPPSLTRVEYMRPVVITPLLFEQAWDFVWVRNWIVAWPLVFGTIALMSFLLIWWRSRLSDHQYITGFILTAVSFFAAMIWGLHAIGKDYVYFGDYESLHSIANTVASEEIEQDVLILNAPSYYEHFLNFRGFEETRVIVLPYAPGERGSFEQIPEVISDDVYEQLKPGTTALVENLGHNRERLWLLMDTGPFLYWSYRPVERYMAIEHHLVREIALTPPDQRVRLLEFAIHPANDADSIYQEFDDVRFDELINLQGFDLPKGNLFSPGELLPITLHWTAEALLVEDFTVALFLTREDSVVFVGNQAVQGYDSTPVGGFMPVSMWESGEVIHDNRAIRLPSTLPANTYHLALRLYRFSPEGEIQTLPVIGLPTIDNDLAVLPVEIILSEQYAAN